MMKYNSVFKLHEVSDHYENILNDLMPHDLDISSMHLSGKLFQMIDNKNKTMIVEMKAPSVCFDDSNNGLKVRIFLCTVTYFI